MGDEIKNRPRGLLSLITHHCLVYSIESIFNVV
jgi:hypothetical protein